MQSTVATGQGVVHPLTRLTAAEIDTVREVLIGAGLVVETTRFAYLGLDEPHKDRVTRWSPSAGVDRRVRVFLLDLATGGSRDVVVSLSNATIVSDQQINPVTDGQPPIILEEFMLVDEIVKSDEGWRNAMERRGITDLDMVRPCPLSAGNFGTPGEEGRRLLRVLSFMANDPTDHCWSHPIDGVVAYVDLTTREVIELIDNELLPVPTEEHNHTDPLYVGPPRTTLRPIEITQPEGPSFRVSRDIVTWEDWQLRIGFDQREGLVLHQVSLRGRPLIYRASIGEMVVPYADPAEVRGWQYYFDAGEYKLGEQVQSLELGCDCLGEIHYFDAVMADQLGQPDVRPNAICMHEEDYSILWRHYDLFTDSREVRRQRRLVISFWATIGNYDYGFYWYLYLDGRVELEVKASGVVFTAAHQPDNLYATQITAGLDAPYHQHLFCARLHMDLDGGPNFVDEVELRRLPMGDNNPLGNAFARTRTRIASEADGGRMADPLSGRYWLIGSSQRTNAVGQPTAYALYSAGQPTLLADPAASITRRAGFATRHLWVTAYHPDERYAAGDLPNQHPGGAGLPAYVAQDRPLDGADLVVWTVFGPTHMPRPEDWPVMPVDSCGFTMRPYGFFDGSPVLDVPASTSTHCQPGHHQD